MTQKNASKWHPQKHKKRGSHFLKTEFRDWFKQKSLRKGGFAWHLVCCSLRTLMKLLKIIFFMDSKYFYFAVPFTLPLYSPCFFILWGNILTSHIVNVCMVSISFGVVLSAFHDLFTHFVPLRTSIFNRDGSMLRIGLIEDMLCTNCECSEPDVIRHKFNTVEFETNNIL